MSERLDRVARGLAARHRAERRFRRYGRLALGLAFAMLAILIGSLIVPGIRGFLREEIRLDIVAPAQGAGDIASAGHLVRAAWKLQQPAALDAAGERAWLRLLAPGYEKEALADMRQRAGQPFVLRVPLADTAATDPRLDAWRRSGRIRTAPHWGFLTHGDSRSPEKAGMASSIVGTLFVLAVTMGLAFPIGVGSAIYLEEFAPRGRLRDVIEVNINNLAAIPSIVYGLLGLAVYLNRFGLPRSSSLAGGLTLGLMTLPVIIITTRAALAAVPPSIRQGALALGASPLQVVAHHTLPLALPGILTGTILGMARAIGETAPLLMIGMVAFIADIPRTPLDPATAMPVQIYLWASSPQAGFVDRTASGILVLIAILLCLNATAIFLRRKYEHRW